MGIKTFYLEIPPRSLASLCLRSGWCLVSLAREARVQDEGTSSMFTCINIRVLKDQGGKLLNISGLNDDDDEHREVRE